jgi:hypothetical protein
VASGGPPVEWLHSECGHDRAYLLELVDDWNERIEEWSYVNGSYLDTLYGVDGHYVRIGRSAS